MENKMVVLRCDDRLEACVFNKYTWSKNDTSYEINIEDSHIGGDYKGFFGRIRRAWKAFIGKPVCYTGVYCDDKEKIKDFLVNCLSIIGGEEPCDHSDWNYTEPIGHGKWICHKCGYVHEESLENAAKALCETVEKFSDSVDRFKEDSK